MPEVPEALLAPERTLLLMNKTLALAMIVKYDELELLRTCLDSVISHVDRAFISVNYPAGVDEQAVEQAVLEFSKGYMTADFFVDQWTHFGLARNQSFKRVPEGYDFILWLDSDDTVTNPEKLRQVCLATPRHIDGIYLAYDYQHDAFGNVVVKHYVARIVRNNGSFRWSNKRLHESLEPVRHTGKAINEEVSVVHHADSNRRDASLIRNIALLEEELSGEGQTPDPRTLFYLGSAYIDAGRLDEAKELLQSYLKLSGWAEERAQAWTHLGNIADAQDDEYQAREYYLHAQNENPRDPTPYVEMAKLEMRTKNWTKAIEWLEMSLAKKTDPMTTINSSEENRYRAHMYLADCFKRLGGSRLEKAYKHAQKALEMRPDGLTRDFFESIEDLIRFRDKAAGVVLALKEFEDSGDSTGLVNFINSLPASLQDNPVVLRFRKRHTPPTVWPKKSVVIFTGNSVVGEWGPWSLGEGVGGSEEAVVRLSRQLTDRGWLVTVYGNPGSRAGAYDGVTWRNYWELNLADTFDVFVGWRMPWFFDIKITARKKYLWLHDVMDKEEFTKERLDNLDKVIVLSQYHRSLFPMIPDSKIFLSANGIDPEDFDKTDGKLERDPQRIVYMSSHVRGLQLLYEVWPEVIKAVPDARLDVCYGWGSFDAVNRDNPERMAWKDMMIKWQKRLKNVTDHGKVSQDKIVEMIQASGVWAYPCPFPEISCITAMKAQAGGAVPVSSDFAALAETVQFGYRLTMQAMDENTPVGKWNEADLTTFKDTLIDVLKHPEKQEAIRQDMMQKTRQTQSWQNVAKGWEREFLAT